jgi:hypothetical protein
MQARVLGFLDGVAFDVVIGDEGIVGSRRVSALARSGIGKNVQLTPVGPVVTVSWNDPRSVVAWLNRDPDCRITTVTGPPDQTASDIGIIR